MPAGRPKLYHTEEELIAARKVWQKRYREAHKELVAERKRKWHQENAESCLARGRARYHRLRELRNRPPEPPELPAPEQA